MKKIIVLTILIIMCVSICACNSSNNSTKKENVYTVVCQDGTKEEMTYKEIAALGKNEVKLESYLGLEISGIGGITSIDKTDNFNAEIEIGTLQIIVKNVPIEVAKTFDIGEKFDIKGKLVQIFGSIVYIDGRGYYD